MLLRLAFITYMVLSMYVTSSLLFLAAPASLTGPIHYQDVPDYPGILDMLTAATPLDILYYASCMLLAIFMLTLITMVMLILAGNLLAPMRSGRLARDDFGILVYHMDVVMQNFTLAQTQMLIPAGTWIMNLVQHVAGVTLTVRGKDSPALFGRLLDGNMITVGSGTVLFPREGMAIGHVYQQGDMIWDNCIIGDNCTLAGMLMARDVMEDDSWLSGNSTPFAGASLKAGRAYGGSLGTETEVVPAPRSKSRSNSPSKEETTVPSKEDTEDTPLLAGHTALVDALLKTSDRGPLG